MKLFSLWAAIFFRECNAPKISISLSERLNDANLGEKHCQKLQKATFRLSEGEFGVCEEKERSLISTAATKKP